MKKRKGRKPPKKSQASLHRQDAKRKRQPGGYGGNSDAIFGGYPARGPFGLFDTDADLAVHHLPDFLDDDASARQDISHAADWPLEECQISPGWNQGSAIVHIVVARRGPNGEIAGAQFFVDLGCLGVRSTATIL